MHKGVQCAHRSKNVDYILRKVQTAHQLKLCTSPSALLQRSAQTKIAHLISKCSKNYLSSKKEVQKVLS